MRSRHYFLAMLFSAVLLAASCASAVEPSIVFGPDFQPNQVDDSVDIVFSPPAGHVEAAQIAQKNGLVKAYQMPSADGKSPQSALTVAFQKKSDSPGMRYLTEFVNVDLHWFKQNFPNSVIAQVNMQGIIDKKFRDLGYPYEVFMFHGNLRPGSTEGDSLVLFFETRRGYWSIEWIVPQFAVQSGFPVFEGFIKDMVVKTKEIPNTSLNRDAP